MVKHTALLAIAAVLLIAPAASASPLQTSTARVHAPIQRLLQSFRVRIRGGVRAGAITADELQSLRTQIQAFQSEVRGIRQAGARPTAEQRQHLRQELRGINRAINAARHSK